MPQTDKQKVGKRGEDEACSHLIGQGFKILERNYWRKWGEIDIVAQKDKVIHFVEVKTVSRDHFSAEDYEPEDNIHPWKRQRLKRIIETYILDKRINDDTDWQVDLVTVYLHRATGRLLKLEHLEDVVI